MNRFGILIIAVACAADESAAQIRVDPTGVNVNAQGATTVFLTFGGVTSHTAAEAFWCGRVVPAAPAAGNKCDPATIFGQLPIRYDQSRLNGTTFTDIMSIPTSVSRRAYEAATAGETSSFFYVRRFVSRTGGAEVYVSVTCRLAGGGARVPFAITHVDLRFDAEAEVLFVGEGDRPPSFEAEVSYNGTGRLRGRWEIVLPGEELPVARDLMTEASLPPGERGLQKRFTEIGRFNVFLPPTGRVVLPGPERERLPHSAEGSYLVLLRIEPSDDKEGDSRLAPIGAGQGVVHSGAVAGFPMPTLRYVVGGGASAVAPAAPGSSIRLILPANEVALSRQTAQTFSWADEHDAAHYRLVLERTSDGKPIFSAIVDGAVAAYRAPAFIWNEVGIAEARWRVEGLDAKGRVVRRSAWRSVRATGP